MVPGNWGKIVGVEEQQEEKNGNQGGSSSSGVDEQEGDGGEQKGGKAGDVEEKGPRGRSRSRDTEVGTGMVR